MTHRPRAFRWAAGRMPVEIAVGPPVLSINNGATFTVSDLAGEIQPDTEQGVFADDTRFVSYYAISARVDLRFWQEGDRSRWAADVREGTIAVQEEPWRPWNPGEFRE